MVFTRVMSGRSQDFHAVCHRLPAQSADDVVRLDPFDSQHW
jgi:hypothetical protein